MAADGDPRSDSTPSPDDDLLAESATPFADILLGLRTWRGAGWGETKLYFATDFFKSGVVRGLYLLAELHRIPYSLHLRINVDEPVRSLKNNEVTVDYFVAPDPENKEEARKRDYYKGSLWLQFDSEGLLTSYDDPGVDSSGQKGFPWLQSFLHDWLGSQMNKPFTKANDDFIQAPEDAARLASNGKKIPGEVGGGTETPEERAAREVFEEIVGDFTERQIAMLPLLVPTADKKDDKGPGATMVDVASLTLEQIIEKASSLPSEILGRIKALKPALVPFPRDPSKAEEINSLQEELGWNDAGLFYYYLVALSLSQDQIRSVGEGSEAGQIETNPQRIEALQAEVRESQAAVEEANEEVRFAPSQSIKLFYKKLEGYFLKYHDAKKRLNLAQGSLPRSAAARLASFQELFGNDRTLIARVQRVLTEHDYLIDSAAVDALNGLDDPRALLVVFFLSKEYPLFERATTFLAGKGPAGIKVLNQALLETRNDDVYLCATQALADAGEASKDAIPGLTKALLETQYNNVCLHAAKALANADADGIRALNQVLLETRNRHVTFYATKALADAGEASKDAIPGLTKALLEARDSDARLHAAKALANASADGIRALNQVLLETRNRYVPFYATKALADAGEASKDAIPGLTKALLEARDSNVRLHAAEALANAGPDGIRALNQVLLEARDSNVHLQAARALSNAGADGIQALSQVLLEAQDSYVRFLAAEALASAGEAGGDALKSLLMEVDINNQLTALIHRRILKSSTAARLADEIVTIERLNGLIADNRTPQKIVQISAPLMDQIKNAVNLSQFSTFETRNLKPANFIGLGSNQVPFYQFSIPLFWSFMAELLQSSPQLARNLVRELIELTAAERQNIAFRRIERIGDLFVSKQRIENLMALKMLPSNEVIIKENVWNNVLKGVELSYFGQRIETDFRNAGGYLINEEYSRKYTADKPSGMIRLKKQPVGGDYWEAFYQFSVPAFWDFIAELLENAPSTARSFLRELTDWVPSGEAETLAKEIIQSWPGRTAARLSASQSEGRPSTRLWEDAGNFLSTPNPYGEILRLDTGEGLKLLAELLLRHPADKATIHPFDETADPYWEYKTEVALRAEGVSWRASDNTWKPFEPGTTFYVLTDGAVGYSGAGRPSQLGEPFRNVTADEIIKVSLKREWQVLRARLELLQNPRIKNTGGGPRAVRADEYRKRTLLRQLIWNRLEEIAGVLEYPLPNSPNVPAQKPDREALKSILAEFRDNPKDLWTSDRYVLPLVKIALANFPDNAARLAAAWSYLPEKVVLLAMLLRQGMITPFKVRWGLVDPATYEKIRDLRRVGMKFTVQFVPEIRRKETRKPVILFELTAPTITVLTKRQILEIIPTDAARLAHYQSGFKDPAIWEGFETILQKNGYSWDGSPFNPDFERLLNQARGGDKVELLRVGYIFQESFFSVDRRQQILNILRGIRDPQAEDRLIN
ncbi:MAG: HEAT repeat domain-containing protein, partial [Candidatus Omnitrophica bacterium]|nr:HEAT repeat domain-containing protein [Candidatus Omnitrophota bacterium]